MDKTSELLEMENLVGYLPVAIAILDRNMCYVSFSEGWIKEFGITGNQMLRSHYEIFPNTTDTLKQLHKIALLSGEEQKGEEKIIFEDGCEKWMKWTLKPFKKRDGIIGGALLSYENITHQKKLEENFELLTGIVESSEDAIIKTNIIGEILTWNKGAYKIFGFTTEEMLGKHITSLLESGSPNVEIGERVRKGETLHQLEVSLLGKENKTIDASVTASPIYDLNEQLTGACTIIRDMTSIKVKERVFKRNSDRSVWATAAANVGIWEFNFDKNELLWSDKMFELYEKEPETFKSNLDDWTDSLHPDDKERAIEEVQLAAKNNLDFNTEFRICTKGGKVKYLKALAAIQTDKAGRSVMVGTNWEITDIKEAQEKLKKSEEKYRTIIENSVYALFLSSPSGEIFYANEKAINIFGYSSEEFKSMGRKGIVDPEDTNIRGLMAIRDKVGSVRGEVTGIRKNGEKFPIEFTSVIFKDINGVLRCSTGIMDITERVKLQDELIRSEQQFRGAFENGAIGMALVSPTGRILEVNDSICLMLGYSKKDLLNLSVQELTYYEDLEENLTLLHELVDGKRRSYTMEKRFIHKEGQIIWVLIAISIVRKKDGSPLHLVSQIQDITERKRAEENISRLNERILKQNKELEISNLELEQFAFIASHDMQEPLRMITGFLNLLNKKYSKLLDEKGKKYVQYAVEGAEKMKRIILDILAYSTMGEDEYESEEIDVDLLLKDVIFLLRNTIQDKHAIVHWGKVPKIFAAKIPMQQLLMNLISNGIKYQAEGSIPEIKIEAVETENHWRFSVIDNGIGIAEKDHDKVFTIFKRLHGKEQYSGTGIGLAICKKIAEFHGGKIWIDSSMGSGSTFNFTIAKK